jgi:hypothetical protein
MESKEWVNSLKAGDNIFVEEVRCFGMSDILTLAKVKSVGKKFITIDDIPHKKNNYNKQTLEETGRKFGRMHMGDSHCRLVEYSNQNLSTYNIQIKRDYCNKVIQKLYSTKLDKVDAGTIERYYLALVQIGGA